MFQKARVVIGPIAVVPFLFIIEIVVLRRDARKSAASLLPHAVVGLFAACKNLGGFQTGDLQGLNLSLVDRVLVLVDRDDQRQIV